MSPEDLEALLEITLGSKVATEVIWETDGDPYAAVEVLNRRAAALVAPYRSGRDDKRHATARKDAARMHLVARVVDEVIYDLDEELEVELVKTA